ncbi:replication endonuclease [Shewanella baltica]|uniref:replication endonuclease n=1 Tax=Shewanella baltica TaxID=62322 RepID=UPI0030D251B4
MTFDDLIRKSAVNVAAVFTTPHAITDLKWSVKELIDLPENVAVTLFREYCRKRRALNLGRSANIWLRKRSASLRLIMQQFPIPIYHLKTDERRDSTAIEWADRCASILNNMTQFGTVQVDALELLKGVKQPADQWQFCPMLPSFKDYNDKKASGLFDASPAMYDMIAGAIARLTDEAWWQRKLAKAYSHYEEHVAIIVGKVRGGVSPYVSHHAFKQYKARKRANAAWLNSMMVVNEEHGIELSLADAVAASIANPKVRRAELMVRMRGFEDLAVEQGCVGEFYTWTAPSCYHSWGKSKKGTTYSNKRYDGATPKQTQAYLCHQWAKARSKLAREGIELFGFRVVEPHHDATPHWHLLLFFKPEQLRQARSIMRRYALEHHKAELAPPKGKRGNNFQNYRPRFDFKTIDPAKGSATGYIAKYIAKNIDGFNVDDDFEAETSGKQGAQNVAAWASTWNIRQFQQIGGPSVTVWRELRRLREAIDFDEIIELARHAADNSNWSRYVEVMGGTFCKRADRPVQLAKVTHDGANTYGEDVQKIIGVMSLENHTQINTRLDGWEIRSPQSATEPQTAQDKAFDLAFACAFDLASKSGDNRATWSTGNNCTQSIKTNEKIAKGDRLLIQEGKKLGLDADDLKRLRAGAVIDSVVNGSHQFIRLRSGMLIVSRQPFNHRAVNDYDDTGLNNQFDAMQRAMDKELKQQLRQQAWQLIDTGRDVEEWVSAMPPATARVALAQLGEIIELHRADKYAVPGVYAPIKPKEPDFDQGEDDEPF